MRAVVVSYYPAKLGYTRRGEADDHWGLPALFSFPPFFLLSSPLLLSLLSLFVYLFICLSVYLFTYLFLIPFFLWRLFLGFFGVFHDTVLYSLLYNAITCASKHTASSTCRYSICPAPSTQWCSPRLVPGHWIVDGRHAFPITASKMGKRYVILTQTRVRHG